MASSGNFAVFSIPTRPESGYSSSDQIRGGGLSIKGPSSGSFEPVIATISPNSGKWYWEYRAGQGGGSSYGRPAIATSEQTVVKNEDLSGGQSGQVGVLFTANNGNKRINGSETSYGNAVSQHDIVQVALDCDNGAVYFGINNTWQNSGNPASGASKTGAALTSGIQNVDIDILHTRYNGGGIDQYNFGQDDTFGGAITAAGNADENGFGVFKYSPQSGFLALCSANLPISDDIDPAQTDDNCPSKLMTTANWAGTAGSKTITGVGFKPDLTIIKSADQAGQDWCLFDTNRGAEKLLEPNQTTNEENNSNSLTAFSTDGFTVGSENRVNGNSFLMTAQCWKANAGTTVTNSDGDIDSTLQANPTAGFSIAEWPSYSGDKKIGHGLSKTPEFIISKLISGGSQWSVFHKDCDSGKSFKLNSTDGQSTQTIYATTFDATTFGLGASFAGSGAGISYIWHSVEGYSKFSSYVGNGNADGPFIFTGHMPRCVWIKRIDSSAEWAVYFWNETTTNASYVRLKQNPLDSRLTFDSGSMNNGELIDFLSNGFKIRDSDAILNASSGNYVYMSWGSVPFKYNNTF